MLLRFEYPSAERAYPPKTHGTGWLANYTLQRLGENTHLAYMQGPEVWAPVEGALPPAT